jgi:predicted O-methyltransferase YrrM
MNHFYQNIGEDWFTYGNLYTEMVHHFKNNSHFVEIGSWRGRSASYMGVEIVNSGYNIKFDCIDTWEGSIEHENHYLVKESKLWDEFNKNIEPVKDIITPIKMDSIEASKLYEDYSLDFIFIDAGHDYKDVVMDIINWVPKLKINGIIGGHDYLSKDNTKCCIGVNRAVDEIFDKNEIIVRDHCWLVNKIIPNKMKSLT